MANIKVSQLPSASSFNDEDYTMVVQNSENKKITKDILLQELYDLQTITFENEWRPAFKAYGSVLLMICPLCNPEAKSPTLNITSADVFLTSGWQPLSDIAISSYNTNETIISFQSSESLVDGNVYLIRMTGTITIE